VLFPVGVIGVLIMRFALPADTERRKIQLDWVGFIALSVALGATQLVLARGQRLDWWDSSEIIAETVIAAIAFWVFVAHCLTTVRPFLELRLLLDRNYAIGLTLVTTYGMLNFTPMVLLPPLLLGPAGYSDTLIGIVVAGRGVGGCIGFLFAGFFGRLLDARFSMLLGFSMLLIAGIWLTWIDLNIGYATLTLNAALQGLAIGLIWVPLTAVAFAQIPHKKLAEASSVFHLMRNLGSSFFISISVAEVMRSTSANYSRLIEQLTPYNKMLDMPSVIGSWNTETVAGLAGISREVARQATMIAYLNAFGMFTVACAISLPLILLMRGRLPERP
jgi:DHA2 family multidrug resistance protein